MPEFKSCPFCGYTNLEVTPNDRFYELQGKHVTASLRLVCRMCKTEMWEHSWGERDYDKRVQMLADKWNRRANDG